MEMKIFPMHDVSAIGLKLDGDEGSSLANPLVISLMDAVFHACGIVDVCQHRLYRLNRACTKEGHLFKILYGIWSRGDGVEEALYHLIVPLISSMEKGDSSKLNTGALADGIHGSQ